MNNSNAFSGEPDPAARVAAHLAVGVLASVIAAYLLIRVLGMRKEAPGYIAGSALLAMVIHHRMDAPLARRLSRNGL
jgi:hypothetical protein